MEMLKSASKIVFLLIAVALVAFTGFNIVDGKDFMVLASMVFSYYFTKNAGVNKTE